MWHFAFVLIFFIIVNVVNEYTIYFKHYLQFLVAQFDSHFMRTDISLWLVSVQSVGTNVLSRCSCRSCCLWHHFFSVYLLFSINAVHIFTMWHCAKRSTVYAVELCLLLHLSLTITIPMWGRADITAL